MDILAPVDGSDCSMRALRYAIDLAKQTDATVDVVHFTDYESASTGELETRVNEVFEEAGVDGGMEVIGDLRLGDFKASDRVGRDILDLVEERGYDQVVMGHHGIGMVESALLGSAATTVVKSSEIPVTIIP